MVIETIPDWIRCQRVRVLRDRSIKEIVVEDSFYHLLVEHAKMQRKHLGCDLDESAGGLVLCCVPIVKRSDRPC